MQKIKTNFSYLDNQEQPVLSQTFRFTPAEAEVQSLKEEVKAEGFPDIHAGALVMTALPRPDSNMIEYLTGGVLSLDASGALTGDPAVMIWLAAVRESGQVL